MQFTKLSFGVSCERFNRLFMRKDMDMDGEKSQLIENSL